MVFPSLTPVSSRVWLTVKPRSKIIITSRSPLKTYWQDPRVEFVAIDFLADLETIVKQMLVVPECQQITHAYFASYVHSDDFSLLSVRNVPLFENFLTAVDHVAEKSLERVCLQTGGKVSFLFLSLMYMLCI